MSGQFQMVIRTGPNPGKTFTLTKKELVLGRDVDNDIVINDAEISRQHIRLVLQNNGFVINDLNSTNGTFVNETRISAPTALRPGDIIRAGDNVTLVYEEISDPDRTVMSGGDSAAAAAPPARPAPAPAAVAPPPAAAPAPPPPAPPAAAPVPQGYAGQVPLSPSQPEPKKASPRTFLLGCAGILILGACIIAAALYYIDVNVLWCDVFGTMLEGCY
ncbi:MAG: FHA domain-containing protein [Anaerolineae bacterium]|nr:FHA domain-containing protein [Anaerolineae bacterium]